MDKSIGGEDRIGNGLAWAETGRQQSEARLQKQLESSDEVGTRRFMTLSNRITQLEEEVADLQRIVKELVK